MAQMKRSPIKLRYGRSPWQFGHLWLPKQPAGAPLVMLLHGGFWRLGKSLDATEGLARALAQDGLAAWNVEYSAGCKPNSWRDTVADAAAGLRFGASFGRRFRLAPDKFCVAGHSAGAHLAFQAVAASQRESGSARPAAPPSGIVSLAGVLDMLTAARLGLGENAADDFLGASPRHDRALYEEASPIHHLPLHVPQLLVHGLLDTRVPPRMSRQYAAAATRAGDRVKLVELPGADHNALIQPATSAGNTVRAMIAQMLGWPLSAEGRSAPGTDQTRT